LKNDTCRKADCDRPVHCRELCHKHYYAGLRRGEITTLPKIGLHVLTDIDVEAATAECAVCGPTRIRVRRNGKSHECITVRRRNRGAGGGASPPQRRFRNYGLTEEDYQALLDRSGGLCEICRDPLDSPNVDHCHATGRVRGLLCRACNTGIGHLKDDPAVLLAALNYLTA
jgi:hypothetical protein